MPQNGPQGPFFIEHAHIGTRPQCRDRMAKNKVWLSPNKVCSPETKPPPADHVCTALRDYETNFICFLKLTAGLHSAQRRKHFIFGANRGFPSHLPGMAIAETQAAWTCFVITS
jgi:hypothetical protein